MFYLVIEVPGLLEIMTGFLETPSQFWCWASYVGVIGFRQIFWSKSDRVSGNPIKHWVILPAGASQIPNAECDGVWHHSFWQRKWHLCSIIIIWFYPHEFDRNQASPSWRVHGICQRHSSDRSGPFSEPSRPKRSTHRIGAAASLRPAGPASANGDVWRCMEAQWEIWNPYPQQ